MQIETDRLILRKHELRDFDRLWLMMTDPIAKQYTGGVTLLTYEQRLGQFREELTVPLTNIATEFAVIEKENGKYLGYCGFRPSEQLEGNEFLYGYCRDAWGKGYGYEAAYATIKYLFFALAIDRLIASVNINNIASVKIIKKLGFIASTQIKTDDDIWTDKYLLDRDEFMSKIKKP